MSDTSLTLPPKPEPKSISFFVKAYKKTPVIIEFADDYDPENPPDKPWENPNNFVVGIGRLFAQDLDEFEEIFGVSVDKFFTIYGLAQYLDFCTIYNPDGENTPTNITYNTETQTYETSFGKIVGSLETNALKVLAFAFSRHGRIVGQEGQNYTFIPVSMDEIYRKLDPDILTLHNGDGDQYFYDVLRITNMFNLQKAGMDNELPKEDEQKNLLPEKSERSRTRSSLKTKADKTE